MSKRAKVLVGLAAVAVTAQLLPGTPRDNPPTTAEMPAPPEIHRILRRSCYDCHSHQTHWPWYSTIAPVSWLVTFDVREGRRRLNFSKWPPSVDPEIDCFFKRRAAELAAKGEMPPIQYRLLHPSTALSEDQVAMLNVWALQECRSRALDERGR